MKHKALDVQVGGDHYKKLKIQPMEYSMANGLDACQHTVVKYVTRFRDKGGIADLEKAKHTIDLLIEFEQANPAPSTVDGGARSPVLAEQGISRPPPINAAVLINNVAECLGYGTDPKICADELRAIAVRLGYENTQT